MKHFIKRLLRENLEHNIILYHGGPFNFESFSTDFMSAGEGNQTFGWGIYFTDNEEIGKFYAKKLYDKGALKDINDKLAFLSKEMNKYNPSGSYRQFNSQKGYDLAKEYDDLIMKRSKLIIQNNTLYTVKISNANWFEWNKKFTEQEVDAIIKQALIDNIKLVKIKNTINGNELVGVGMGNQVYGGFDAIAYNTERFYNFLFRESSNTGIKTDKEASLFLNRVGYDGIKYLANTLSIGGENFNGFNYVVFDVSKIKIINKINLADIK